MRARSLLVVCGLLAAATLSITSFMNAQPPSAGGPLDASEFTPIEPSAILAPSVGPGLAAEQLEGPAAIVDFPAGRRSFDPRPSTPVAAPTAASVAKATPRPATRPVVGSSHRVGGSASWYCRAGTSPCTVGHAGGLYAAAGPELRVGNWRGRYVRVCAGSSCVTVKLIDWCGCPGSRVIDLYSDAFRRIAPLSTGVVPVTVRW